MKKTGILNRHISKVVASMGHYQELLVCDAGFPTPQDVQTIDLALRAGLPSFLDVLEVLMQELAVEQYYLARETSSCSPDIYEGVIRILPNVRQVTISHEELKEKSNRARACVRTGECTKYANILLVSGVVF